MILFLADYLENFGEACHFHNHIDGRYFFG